MNRISKVREEQAKETVKEKSEVNTPLGTQTGGTDTPTTTEEPKSLIDKPKSLMERIENTENLMKNIADMNPKKSKKKNFKMPYKVKSAARNLTKMMEKNKVQVLMFKISGGIHPTIGEINAGRLIIGEMFWNAADDIIWQWMGKIPTAVVLEWDMQPLTKRRLMDDTNTLKTWLHPQTIILRAIEAKEASEKMMGKQMKPMMFIVIGIIVISAYYLFFGG